MTIRLSLCLGVFVFKFSLALVMFCGVAFVCVGLEGVTHEGHGYIPLINPAQAAHLTSAAEIGKTENHTNQRTTGNQDDGREQAGDTDSPGDGGSAALGRSPLGGQFQVSALVLDLTCVDLDGDLWTF